MKFATEDLGIALREAIEVVSDRWTLLAERCPERFNVSLGGYWAGFYS